MNLKLLKKYSEVTACVDLTEILHGADSRWQCKGFIVKYISNCRDKTKGRCKGGRIN